MLTYLFNELRQMVKDGCRLRWEMECLPCIDALLQRYLDEYGYDASQVGKRALDAVPDMQDNPEHPLVTIKNVARNMHDTFNAFLGRYALGYLTKACINQRGVVEVGICCTIQQIGQTDGCSAKETMEARLSFLESCGIDIGMHESGVPYLRNTAGNHNVLCVILESRGAHDVLITAERDSICSITFSLQMKDVARFDVPPISMEHASNSRISEGDAATIIRFCDEILTILKRLDEIPEPQHGMCYLMVRDFSRLCRIYGYKSLAGRLNDTSEMDNTERICTAAQASLIKLIDALNHKAVRTLGLYIDTFDIGAGGDVRVVLKTAHDFSWWGVSHDEVAAQLRTIFCVAPDNYCKILSTPANLEKIGRMIGDDIPSFEMCDVVANMRNGEVTISEIHGYIPDITGLINVPPVDTVLAEKSLLR